MAIGGTAVVGEAAGTGILEVEATGCVCGVAVVGGKAPFEMGAGGCAGRGCSDCITFLIVVSYATGR